MRAVILLIRVLTAHSHHHMYLLCMTHTANTNYVFDVFHPGLVPKEFLVEKDSCAQGSVFIAGRLVGEMTCLQEAVYELILID